MFQTGANLEAQLVVGEESLSAENAHVKRIERECAVMAEKRQ